jgi:hypothetical protein
MKLHSSGPTREDLRRKEDERAAAKAAYVDLLRNKPGFDRQQAGKDWDDWLLEIRDMRERLEELGFKKSEIDDLSYTDRGVTEKERL